MKWTHKLILMYLIIYVWIFMDTCVDYDQKAKDVYTNVILCI
jgi:hypothetical protein